MDKVCPICNNRRHVFQEGKGWVRCKCMGQLRAYRLMSQSGFPDSLWSIESESFKYGNDANRNELGQGILSILKQDDRRPVFIYSETTDKDMAAAIICRYLAILHDDIKSIMYITIDQLVQKQFKRTSFVPATEELDPITADIVVIAIGRELTNDAHRSALYNILYDRLLSNRFTIVSSALSKERILQVYRKGVNTLIDKNFVFYSC